MSKTMSKQEEALQLLDDLDSLNASADAVPAVVEPAQPGNEGDPAEVLAFLDEITQKSSEPTRPTTAYVERPISRAGTPTLRKSTERIRVSVPNSSLHPSSSKAEAAPAENAQLASNRWGWGSVWNSASAAIQQARSVVDEQVKHLPKNEQVSKWGEGMLEYAKVAQLEKFSQDFKRVGLSTLTDILNVVAPPISEHEVIQVWLSHDLSGYEGVESLVYRSLARIMEQVDGGDLIVNRGNESRPKDSPSGSERNLNAVEGYEAALNLAQANLNELIKNKTNKHPEPASSVQNPVTYSTVHLRIQPFTSLLGLPKQTDGAENSTPAPGQSNLQFILHLSDPDHQLVHTTVTQAVPASWLDLWDEYDWVEDLVAESIRVGVEVLGQEYVISRMGWGRKKSGREDNRKGKEKETSGENEKAEVQDRPEEEEKEKEDIMIATAQTS